MIYERPYTTGSHDHTFSHTHTINTPTTWSSENAWEYYTNLLRMRTEQPKGAEMTTLDKVSRERKEAAEREKINALYEVLDQVGLESTADGTVVRFDVGNGDVKTYAALHANERWWATGSTAPNGVGLEDLLAWMIRKGVDPDTIEVLS